MYPVTEAFLQAVLLLTVRIWRQQGWKPREPMKKGIRGGLLPTTEIRSINQLYKQGMDEDTLYDAVRGVWKASYKKVQMVDYVFGVYNSLIVAVYKPVFVCKHVKDKLPSRIFS